MIFDELVIQNFGVYRGRHAVAISPKSPKKPIILIGALNGSGKTTFLDALQLALYGKFANCSNRGSLSYHEFLRKTINHHVDPSDGAGLELEFRHTRAGCEDTYRIVRSWRSTGKGIREDVDVSRNGEFDAVLTERWYEYVDEFMPAPISSLFFFDGEKIEGLAEAESSASLVRTGINALLGLDLVDQLRQDLSAVETRRKMRLQSETQKTELTTLDDDISAANHQREALVQRLGSARNELDQTEKRISALRDSYRKAGGELYDQRESLAAEARAVQQRLDDATGKLKELAAGSAPLLLVPELLSNARHQAKAEDDAKFNVRVSETLATRDSQLIGSLSELGLDDPTLASVRGLLRKDISQREEASRIDEYLDVTPLAFGPVDPNSLKETRNVVQAAIAHHDAVADHMVTLQRQLANVPADDAIAEIVSALQATERDQQRAQMTVESLERELGEIDRHLEKLSRDRERHLSRVTEARVAEDTTRRVLKHAEKSRRTLELFRNAVASRHTARLENAILESFELLLRKSSLVADISIDPDTYSITLFDEERRQVAPERLSAGERQLLAVAILWGLAKSSGRPLPCVIDTPLGRLDSNHRRNLVEHYFPFASHQVILLSTDEEISGDYHEIIKKAVGREYVIQYEEENKTSSVSAGFFS